MTAALIIIGSIAAIVLLLCTLPLTIVITCHTTKGIRAKAGFPPFFYLTLYPTYEDIYKKDTLLDAEGGDEELAAYIAKKNERDVGNYWHKNVENFHEPRNEKPSCKRHKRLEKGENTRYLYHATRFHIGRF